jgi:putative hydrolase of the HAD superfamily
MRGCWEGELTIRAVVFDYGMVLSLPPVSEARAELLRISGLSEAEFEKLYWVDRHEYDRGDLSGLEFWAKLVADGGLKLSDEQVAELNAWDARMWTTANPAMLAWHQRLKARGIETAILSNMGDSVLESVEREFAWVADFDVLIWSYQHGCAKPEPAIYELLLDRLGTAGEETLFLDDKVENLVAARAFGIRGIQFSTVGQLRKDLIAEGFDAWLPLPAE